MAHVNERITGRVKPIHKTIADNLITRSQSINDRRAYAIASKVDRVNCADGSNGSNLVLIVRNNYPVTIMYTRDGQMTAQHLRVENIITL